MKAKCLWLAGSVVFGMLVCNAAMADSLTVILTQSTPVVTQGTTVVAFDATVSNPPSNSDTLFLNDSGGSTSDPTVTLDVSPFFTNAPISLDPGQSSDPFELFDLDLPSNVSGMYSGIFTIYGGTDPSGDDDLADVSFSVDVVGPTVTPEPSMLVLYGLGLLLMGGLLVRRRVCRPI